MLHAFDTSDGKELWAFVPYPTLATIGQTVQREYAFKTKLDGTPTIGKYTDGGSKLLVAGMRTLSVDNQPGVLRVLQEKTTGD